MSDDNLNENPFVGLFPTPNEAAFFLSEATSTTINTSLVTTTTTTTTTILTDSPPTSSLVPSETINQSVSNSSIHQENNFNLIDCFENKHNDNIKPIIDPDSKLNDDVLKEKITNEIIEQVFGLILNHKTRSSSTNKQLVSVDSDDIENGIFERLTLLDIQAKLVPIKKQIITDPHFIQPEVISYLFECYCRLERIHKDNDSVDKKFLDDTINYLKKITLRSVGTALQPDIFQDQEIHTQYIRLFMDDSILTQVEKFTQELSVIIMIDYPEDYQNIFTSSFKPILEIINNQVVSSNLIVFRNYWFNVLQTFSNIEPLAEMFISYCTPITLSLSSSSSSLTNNNQGSAYGNTLLGNLLSLSCLPKTFSGSFDFFNDKPLIQPTITTTESNIWTATDALCESLYKIMHSLLKCSVQVRHLTLDWLGKCLQANASRGKLWNNSQITMGNNGLSPLVVSDGFMLNLGNVLLRLCQPFCTLKKIPKIDPTYCAAAVESLNEDERRTRGIHLVGINKETCLIPSTSSSDHDNTNNNECKKKYKSTLISDNFGFITECFYFTHRSLDLGYRIVLDKLMKTNQELGRIQRIYNDAQSSPNSQVFQIITQRMEMEMTKYLSYRASLLSPAMLNLLAKFHATTAFWLMQVIVDIPNNDNDNDDTVATTSTTTTTTTTDDDNDDNNKKKKKTSYNLLEQEPKPITFPLPETVPETLKYIPEFILENTIGFICFLRRFNPNIFEEQGENFLNPILTEIIVLMESPKRLFNPHLRAQLAETLEALLPNSTPLSYKSINDNGDNVDNDNGVVIFDYDDDDNDIDDDYHNSSYSQRQRRQQQQQQQQLSTLGTFNREKLFINHPHCKEIVKNLIEVFVSIEMTGQSVQFEQKFNYRRPMYTVMKYLWKIKQHRDNFKYLAKEAEDNMEAVNPPLFLRFINLLMNDAVFLLDEALSNMAQLKKMLRDRENGEWDKLPAHERDQQINNLNHIGMIARFDNILGRETISTLKMLTSEIKSIFCHSTMVDRIASMLNYLLFELVGPNKKNFKVKDQKEYEFKPAKLVLNICVIYINLGTNDNFTLAVSQDGRSYRNNLFQLANDVLLRIGGISILDNLDKFSIRVANAAAIKKQEEEILTDAPDEFLDPIMSTLMIDPVILPSSKISVDRQTIARHLLSDQTDPFNRSPLTMDMVKSDVNLRNRIQEWITSKKQSSSSSSLPSSS
ncbi:ubiquitin conjugation factor E4 A [Microplitis mediator]|uniref:ubiquitin conjugation factor E4 A n=1 Tax=Microplitis mediator TaxID=375433 RepID=UPI0025546D8A|nr:ubiquitin conjugation factor E4 A [Microplitis mediator]